MDADDVDEIDQLIIDHLREDGRASFTSIAQSVGLSTDAVRVRMSRLTSEGVLRVIGLVHPGSLGYHSHGAVSFDFTGSADQLAERVRRVPAVTFLAQTIGEAGAICEVTARHDGEFADVVTRELACIPGVSIRGVARHLVIVKWDSQARPRATPQAVERGPLDEVDSALLRHLVGNPRLSYRELATLSGHPYWLVRRRAQALFDDGVLQATAMVDRVSVSHEVRGHLSLELGEDWGRATRLIGELPGVAILVLTSGSANAHVEFGCASAEQAASTVRSVAAVPGVRRVTSSVYARILILPTAWRFVS